MDILQQKMYEQNERVKKVRSWSARIKRLTSRKRKPMTEVDFCVKHGINNVWFNRLKNGKTSFIPSKKSVDKIEAALKSEGV